MIYEIIVSENGIKLRELSPRELMQEVTGKPGDNGKPSDKPDDIDAGFDTHDCRACEYSAFCPLGSGDHGDSTDDTNNVKHGGNGKPDGSASEFDSVAQWSRIIAALLGFWF